jgi:cytochrome d ubiquinol oxidase subunit II
MLAEVPIVFILVGIAAYTVLAGADFGAGFWTLFPGGGQASPAVTRDHARHAIGPVWEANHVWLIFVLVVCWTAYPVAFASIVSTLTVPLFIAVVGIILRGASYALRGQLEATRGRRFVERVFALSSVLTPFAMGTVAGAIASLRIPVGNAAGNLVTSWLNPTSIVIGLLAVGTSSYLAAVYLAADAGRFGDQLVERDFRARALASGVVTGALAVAGLIVVRLDARAIWNGLTTAAGLVMLGISGAAGLITLFLVWRNRFVPARVSAALAVAAIVAGWAVAQQPFFLSGLTVSQAAASRSTLIAVVVAVAIGAVVLVPSLILLFGLFLRGRLDAAPRAVATVDVPTTAHTHRPRRLLELLAAAFLVLGVGITIFIDPGPAFIPGPLCLFGAAVTVFVLATTAQPDI